MAKKLSPHTLHRWVGVCIAMIVIMLTITGILLNHTEQLKLAQRQVNNPWLLDWYGIQLPKTILSFNTTHHYVTQMGLQLYIDDGYLQTIETPLIGVVELNDMLIIALSKQLILLTQKAELIERITVDFGIEQLGITNDQRLIAADHHQSYTTDDSLFSWMPATTNNSTQWSKPTPLPETLLTKLRQHYLGQGLPVERIVLDIHSGRFLGEGGIWLIDIAAILFCLLAISGLWMWATRALTQRQRKKKMTHGKKNT